jgi:hypothetical protein
MKSVKKIKIGEVNDLLNSGKRVSVKTLNGEFTNISKYIDKGILKTYEVELKNGKTIKVSREHEFYTNSGWILCENLKPDKHSILCDDGHYYVVTSVKYIGEHRIVDITVDHPDHCYFGNGMLNHNSGKTLLAMHALAETQKKGGVAVFIDTESSLDIKFVRAIGVRVESLCYISCDHVEEIFDHIETLVEKIRIGNKNKLVTIVVDSVAAASCVTEMESDHGKDGYATGKAIIISKAMRKITQMIARQRICLIFTNQVRQNLGATFGEKWCVDPYTTKIKIKYEI